MDVADTWLNSGMERLLLWETGILGKNLLDSTPEKQTYTVQSLYRDMFGGHWNGHVISNHCYDFAIKGDLMSPQTHHL